MIDEVRDHWYWRPGWRPGRSFYTFHLTFTDSPALANLATSYAAALAQMPNLTPVPLHWLHLTMQGVGFADRVPEADLTAIAEAAEFRLERCPAFEISIGPAVIDPESVQLPVTPTKPLQDLRNHIRAAIADVWGPDSVPELPDLTPHISLGYFNNPAPAPPLAALLPTTTATTPITTISLINLHRNHQQYEWTTRTTFPLS